LEYVTRVFKVYPQYEVIGDNYSCRIDIAIFLERVKEERKNGKKHDVVIETKKVALECDGYEYHSTKEQQTNDSKRARKLERDGWRVIRYSGAELYKINDDEDFNKIFDEIIDILFAK
jgi:very-short-patch-repair endonuclease